MNQLDFHTFLEKHEDQALAKVLMAWRLVSQDDLRSAYQEMQQMQSSGAQCKLGQILIKKRLIQIADYTKATQLVRQQLQILYQKAIDSTQQAVQEPNRPAPKEQNIVNDQQEKMHDTHKKIPSIKDKKTHTNIKSENTGEQSGTKQKAKHRENQVKETAVIQEATPENGTPNVTKKFGSYEIISEIARGGMGIVYKARQHPLNRIVALKVLLSGGAASEIEIERFRREAESAGALQHPNIVSIYEIGEEDGYHYFTMDFIEGPTLQALIKKKTRLKKLLQIFEKVALALEHAHQRGVIHRDIKPSNILVSMEGEPKITDFGLAKKLDANTMLTESGAALGTPFYMAPEQTLASKNVDARVDIYAMGVMLYEILTGRLPFVADTLVDLYRKIVEEDPSPPSKLNHKADREIETICLKAMEKSPEQRYQTAREFAEDIKRYLSGSSISAKRASVFQRLQKKIKRSRQKIIVMGGIAVVVFSLIFFICLKTMETSEQDKKLEKAKMLIKEGENLVKSENETEFNRGIEKIEEAIRVYPQWRPAYFAKGDALQKKRRYSNASTEYERVLRQGKDEPRTSYNNAHAYFKKGECEVALEQWDKAIDYFTKAIDTNPPHKIKIEAYHKRGEAYQNRKKEDDWQKAIDDFNAEEKLKK